MNPFSRKPFTVIAFATDFFNIYFQQGGTKTADYGDLSLKDLLNVKIVSASRKSELSFNTLLYPGNIARKWNIDIEVFDIQAKNYSSPVLSHAYTQVNGIDTIELWPIRPTNLPAVLNQKNVTVSRSWIQKKLQAKPFITIQNTRAKNYAPDANTPDASSPYAAQANIYLGMGTTTAIKTTPAVLGGVSFNYYLSKLDLNITTYYYSAQTYYHVSNIIFNDGSRGIDNTGWYTL